TNSLAMITDFVPGAYVSHEMLHVRGGHQLGWLIDGVAIPNTNIASNIGPQIDPKDIDTLEIDRGSYNADLGDRTFGIFNIVPRTGFERNREGELVLTAGNFLQTNDQISLGDHSAKFAWFASLNANRSNYGLQPAIPKPVHDAETGYGGFGSIVYNPDNTNQLRLIGQLRTDFYQIPRDPDPSDWESSFYDSTQTNDGEHETDSFATLTWLHTYDATTTSQLAPFFHFNRADYQPGPNDFPIASTAKQTGSYAGLQAALSTIVARNTISAGVYGYAQHENNLFAADFKDDSSSSFSINPILWGGVEETYIEDSFKPVSWLTLTGGLRQTAFRGDASEDVLTPRVGVAFQLPKLNWVFRAFYGQFYQPPPLTSIAGPALRLANANQTAFIPLKGERDEEHQFGVQIPFLGWLLDADTFTTRARNFLDHDSIGESSIFIPLTIQGALINAWEVTLRSPHLWRYGQAHLSYSNQVAKQKGSITGGLICYNPDDPSACEAEPGYSPLDHDQRNTLSVGFNASLPHSVFGSFNVSYGSGFANGTQDPPSPYTGEYLPSHTTADVSFGKSFGERYSVSVNALNVTNSRVLIDNSVSFGGFHYNDPRQIYGEFRLHFKY
ncbi:MAG TPA: hypothetical protein VLI45_09560, partial [Acidobacteriaceae bacterium]|nr:hypothetical protein [Acidobacteriaceae bacterium]